MNNLLKIKKEIKAAGNPERAKSSAWFFKTGKGDYGYGDVFVGITVPEQRKIAKRYFRDMNFPEVQKLLQSKIHEERFIALEILVMQFEGGNLREQKEIFNFYLAHTRYINNWDLVDTSAPYIVGAYLFKNRRGILIKLAKSASLWERRIAIVSTAYFIGEKDFSSTITITKLLLNDEHDLIHKAVGWMLREVGKRDIKILLNFLDEYTLQMPRTTLRYAIERLPEPQRLKYLKLR